MVIYGGGFGGLYTAIELDRLCRSRGWYNWNILIVDPKQEFVFLPLLYDLSVAQTATTQEVCPTYHDLLSSIPNTNIRHLPEYTLHTFEMIDKEEDTKKKKRTGSPLLKRPPPAILKHTTTGEYVTLYSKASIIAVGATPQSILSKIPGAVQYGVQPFYTKQDAIQTRILIEKVESKIASNPNSNVVVNIAVIGGGFGGVELAACIQRKLSSDSAEKNDGKSQVYLVSRTPRPMKDTRAEPWIQQTLQTIGVKLVVGTVQEIQQCESNNGDDEDPKYHIVFQGNGDDDGNNKNDNYHGISYDAILWTAGSSPSFPIGTYLSGEDAATANSNDVKVEKGSSASSSSTTVSEIFETTNSGCLAVDPTLRCRLKQNGDDSPPKLPIWSLGDCAEIVNESDTVPASTPKTAQAAMQQASVVANNVFAYLTFTSKTNTRNFKYQDLGTMFHLGGLNAAIMGPNSSTTSDTTTYANINDLLASSASTVLPPLLELTDRALRIADQVLEQTVGGGGAGRGSSSPASNELFSGLSFSSHGLGATTSSSSSSACDDAANGADEDGTETTTTTTTTTNGSLLGSVSGAARRVVYAARMPTPKQQTISAVSALVNTATELSKELQLSSAKKSTTPKASATSKVKNSVAAKSSSTTTTTTSSPSPSTTEITSDGSTRGEDRNLNDNVEER